MRSAVIISALFHVLVAVLVFVGVPFIAEDELSHDRVIIVELVSVADARNLPNRMADPEMEPDSEPPPQVAEQSLPEPEPQQALRSDPAIEPPPTAANDQTAPPPPPPSSAPAPVQIAAPAPPPLPRAKPENETPPPPAVERPTEKPTPPEPVDVATFEPEPPPQPQKETPKPVERPEEKPKPPEAADPFASVLKSIEELEQKRRIENEAAQEAAQQEPDLKPESPSFDPVEQVLAESNTSFRANQPLSMSEIDNIRYQIQKNWNVPAGARGAQNMIVALRIKLTRDGRVISVSVVDAARMRSDLFFRTMAESAMRAVNVTRQIRDLSPEKYHLWRDMQINFDPTDMFG